MNVTFTFLQTEKLRSSTKWMHEGLQMLMDMVMVLEWGIWDWTLVYSPYKK